MSSTKSAPGMLWRFALILRSFLAKPGLPFAEALSEERIEQAFAEEEIDFGSPIAGEDEVVYTPAVTLWAFLSQMLYAEEQRSCLAAVARVAVLWAALGKQVCASNSGAYCRARAKLTESVLERLGANWPTSANERCRMNGGGAVDACCWATARRSACPTPRTIRPAIRNPPVQQPGLGFPLVRLVVLFSLATGLLHEVAMGPYAGKETGEPALLREMFERLKAGDVLVADRCYCGWFLIALLQALGVDVVVRLHQMREADFQQGERLGKGDHLVEWPRPPKPDWMDAAAYARMPASLRLREVQVQVAERGFRVQSLVVVTTLLDSTIYPADQLATLYRRRWLVELDVRTIKSTLKLDVLRCKTPDMARKELRTGLLAYNLLRQTMLQAAIAAGRCPRELSFTVALQTIAAAWMVAVITETHQELLVQLRLAHLGSHRIGHRPNRTEPRAIKRRPKPHDLLTEPRDQARAKLLASHRS